MIGVDTNVLLRFLTADDPKQSPAAKELLASRTAEDPAYISLVTLVEAVCALGAGRYGYSPGAILDVIGDLAAQDAVRIQEHSAVVAAIASSRRTSSGFVDTLVAELGARAGCAHTATFDRSAAAALPAMRLIHT